MQINDGAALVTAALAGWALGTAFFGGLWWTVLRGAGSPKAGVWFSVSFLLRTALALGGFYLVGAGHWPRLAGCLAGFLAARSVVLRLSRPAAVKGPNAP